MIILYPDNWYTISDRGTLEIIINIVCRKLDYLASPDTLSANHHDDLTIFYINEKQGSRRDILALLSLCNPEIIEPFKARIANHEQVAAKFAANALSERALANIQSIDGQEYSFKLNLLSRNHQSKGNWLWVKQLQIRTDDALLLTVTLQPRIIDIPYTNQLVCAHWLMRSVANELTTLLNDYL